MFTLFEYCTKTLVRSYVFIWQDVSPIAADLVLPWAHRFEASSYSALPEYAWGEPREVLVVVGILDAALHLDTALVPSRAGEQLALICEAQKETVVLY